MADRTLVVKLVGDEADLLRSYTRAGKATKQFGDTTDSSLRKADRRFKSLKTAGAGFAGGLIAGEVFRNLNTFIDKAAESEAVLTQVKQGLKNTGQTWEQYGDKIEDTVRQQSKLGFDDEDLLTAFDKFDRQVGKVDESLDLLNLTMDVARGRNIDLEAAQRLVGKAAGGQRGALTRLGIEVDKNADKTDLLRILTEKYGGSAKAAADDARTAQERLAVQLENVQESIGTKLLPVVGQLADGLEDGLAAADGLVETLRKIGQAKIPVINIPLNFKIPGSQSKIADLLFKTNVFEVAGFAKEQIFQTNAENERVRSAIAEANRRRAASGQPPIVIESQVNIDGEAVGRSQKKVTEKDRRRNPRQKRGPNSAFR